jgi:glycosyltransferase involved in cell wall biosynthesis
VEFLVTRRIALVTHGYEVGGGVPAVTRWLRDGLSSTDAFQVDVHDLATSRRDPYSRLLTSPRTWSRASLQARRNCFRSWGANAAELEFMRYRPRREFTRALRAYDLVQVVAGTPAWAYAVLPATVPVVLQVATLARWERAAFPGRVVGTWRRAMTLATARLERAALRRVDAVLVENAEMLSAVRAAGQDQVQLAPPGVDTEIFCPGTDGWQRDGDLLSVCRLADPRKGIDRTLHAYAALLRLRDHAPDLVLAGRGALPDALRDLIGDLGLTSRVRVRENPSAAELIQLYRGASVFVQTSHEEGLGVSVLEAMASGVPVVATSTAGSRETVADGVTGYLLSQSFSPGDFATRVHELLSTGAPFAEAARKRCVTAFSTAATLRRFTDTYASLLRRPSIPFPASR